MSTETKTTRKARKASKPKKGGKKQSLLPLPTDNITNRRIGDVRADVRSYVRCKTAAGNMSMHNGDPVAVKLVGKQLDEVYALTAKTIGVPVSELKTRYSHLNPGMQRMNLGNVLRGAL